MTRSKNQSQECNKFQGPSLKQLMDVGFDLVQIPMGKKGPTHKGWNEKNHISPDIRSFDGCNVGLKHAYSRPPTIAVDGDNLHYAKQWLASHGIDLCDLLESQDAVQINSGRPNRFKLLYRLPQNVAPIASKSINDDLGSVALEFRCATKEGKTVQDVIPPSIHPEGFHYRWGGRGNPLQVPVIPSNLLSVWLHLVSNSDRVAFRKLKNSTIHPPETPRQVATLQNALRHVSADCDYKVWRNVTWAILSTGWLCAEDMAIAWSRTAPNRFDEDAFWTLANSYIPGLDNPITVGTIYYHAGLGGWHG